VLTVDLAIVILIERGGIFTMIANLFGAANLFAGPKECRAKLGKNKSGG